jgi:uncharacterized protein GlcG (DUF336 family)
MANSYDMKRRVSTPVTVSLSVAFIAQRSMCSTGYQQASFDSRWGETDHCRRRKPRQDYAGTGFIAIVGDRDNLPLELLDHTFPAAANISIGKARTAASFEKPTLTFEDAVDRGRTSMTALKDFIPLQGGVPIEVDGKAVGAIGVSGAANAQQDQEVALAGASAANRFASQSGGSASSPAPNSGPAAVTYVDKTHGRLICKRRRLYPGTATINRSLRVGAISPARLKYIR